MLTFVPTNKPKWSAGVAGRGGRPGKGKEMTNKQLQRAAARTWPYGTHRGYEAGLRRAAALWFAGKGAQTAPGRPYCLARHDMWRENIILPEVADYVAAEHARRQGDNGFPLHQWVHHGLSSQAMVFNLIGPLIVRGDLGPLQVAVGRAGIGWPGGTARACFEHSDCAMFNEDPGHPTSIDVVVEGQGGNLYIESKMVERGFGGCSVFADGDCEGMNPYPDRPGACYLHHIGRKYWTMMAEMGFGMGAGGPGPRCGQVADPNVGPMAGSSPNLTTGPVCPFASYYQFYREVMFAIASGGSFVLLHDDRNPAFLKTADGHPPRGLWPFLVDSIPPNLRDRVGRITMQSVVQAIDESGRHADWIGDFRAKYFVT